MKSFVNVLLVSGFFLALSAISLIGTGASPAIDDHHVALLDQAYDVADLVIIDSQDPAFHTSGHFYEVEDREWHLTSDLQLAETDDLRAFDTNKQFRKARDGLSQGQKYLANKTQNSLKQRMLKRPRDLLHFATYLSIRDDLYKRYVT